MTGNGVVSMGGPFPPVSLADENGLLCVGGELSVETLLSAYSSGIFPWPVFEDDILTWFSPPERALLFLEDFRVPKSLQRSLKRGQFRFRSNSAFDEVVRCCANSKNRVGQDGTWITKEIQKGYSLFHKAGYAHSIECYLEDELVAGLYGVSLGGMFAGESMFYSIANCSKLCLWALVELLRRQNVTWIDCQQMTDLFESFGARLVPREEYLELLSEAIAKPTITFSGVDTIFA